MKLKSIIFGTALFATGVISSDRVRHELASMRATEHIPLVAVHYTKEGAYVNGERVYENRIGAARCDWDSIAPASREHYALSEFQKNPRAIADFLKNSPGEDQRRFVYFALVQMARKAGASVAAEADSLRAHLGYRWEMPWQQR